MGARLAGVCLLKLLAINVKQFLLQYSGLNMSINGNGIRYISPLSPIQKSNPSRYLQGKLPGKYYPASCQRLNLQCHPSLLKKRRGRTTESLRKLRRDDSEKKSRISTNCQILSGKLSLTIRAASNFGLKLEWDCLNTQSCWTAALQSILQPRSLYSS